MLPEPKGQEQSFWVWPAGWPLRQRRCKLRLVGAETVSLLAWRQISYVEREAKRS